MNLTVFPGNPLRGALSLPGDKSLSHRATLLAAMATGESRISNFLVSGVTRAMLAAITALGVEWELEGTSLRVDSPGIARWQSPATPIDCGNSATTIRLLAGALAAAGIPAVLDGSPGLRRRPMQRIVAPLQQMGVSIEAEQGCAPLRMGASALPLKAIDHDLPVASAQLKSCLLLAALAAHGTTTLREPGPSRDHTERMLSSLGVEVRRERVSAGENPELYVTRLTPYLPLSLPPFDLELPGDISAAAFLIVAALVTSGSRLSLRGVGLNPTRTGILDALQSMGADIQVQPTGERGGEPVGDITVSSSDLHGTQVSGPLVVRMIDEFPAFAVAAACGRGRTVVCDAQELHLKESDRISAMCEELRSIGVQAQDTPDGFIIDGKEAISGGTVSAQGDHRLAMSLAVAGLASREPVTVQGAEIIHESFPGFVEAIHSVGGRLEQNGG